MVKESRENLFYIYQESKRVMEIVVTDQASGTSSTVNRHNPNETTPGMISYPSPRPPLDFRTKFKKYFYTYMLMTLGIQFTIIQCMCTSVSALFVSYIHSVSPMEISLVRLLFQLFVAIPFLIYFKDPFWPAKDYFWAITLRSVSSTAGITAMIYSYVYMPISDANAISRTSPVFVIVLGRIFLKEKITRFEVALVASMLVGMLLITKPEFIFGSPQGGSYSSIKAHYPHNNKGAGFALMSAVTISISMISIKKANTPMAVNMFNFSVVGTILLVIIGVPLKLFSLPACNLERLYLFLASVCGALSQIFLYLGLRYENAGIVAALNSVAIIYSLFLQIVFIKRIPEWNSWVGSTIIIIAIVCYGLRKFTLNRKKGPLISKYLF